MSVTLVEFIAIKKKNNNNNKIILPSFLVPSLLPGTFCFSCETSLATECLAKTKERVLFKVIHLQVDFCINL